MEGSDSQPRLNLSCHSVLLAGRHRNELSWKTIKAAREVETCLLDSGKTPFSWQQRLQSKALRGPGLWVRDPPHPGESHGWERSANGGYSELGRPAPPSSLAEGLQPEDCWLRCLFTQAFPHRIWISFHEEIQKPQALLQNGSEELPPPGIACPQRSPPTPGVHPVCK